MKVSTHDVWEKVYLMGDIDNCFLVEPFLPSAYDVSFSCHSFCFANEGPISTVPDKNRYSAPFGDIGFSYSVGVST